MFVFAFLAREPGTPRVPSKPRKHPGSKAGSVPRGDQGQFAKSSRFLASGFGRRKDSADGPGAGRGGAVVTCRVAGKGRRASRAAPWGRPEVRRCPAPCQTHEGRRSGHLPSWSSGTTPAGGTGADGLFLQPRSLTRVAQEVGRGAPRDAVGLGSSPGTSVSVALPPVTPASGAAWERTATLVITVLDAHGVLGGVPAAPPAAAAPGPGSGRTGWGGVGAPLGRSGVVSRSGPAVAPCRREGVGLRPGPARRRHIGLRPRGAHPSPGPRSLQSYPLPARKPTDFLWPPPNKNP